MSNHKVLVSDETIRKWSEGVSFAECVAEEVRDVYEHHIAEGRLVWLEETEYVPPDTWCSVCICVACGEACGEIGEKEPYPYCPYCRRKIGRPRNPKGGSQ